MPLRPGSTAAQRLFASDDINEWVSALDHYDQAVAAVGESRKKRKELIEWDRFVREDLPPIVKTQGKLSKDQLVLVVNWKLTRGKFRPLMNQVLSNPDKAVEDATATGFELASNTSDIRKPLQAISALRGIGPATASAVLAPVWPDRFPFMADEALEGAGMERAYTEATYISFAERLRERAKKLGGKWDAESVGRSLWSTAMSDAYSLHRHAQAGDKNIEADTSKKRGEDKAGKKAAKTQGKRKKTDENKMGGVGNDDDDKAGADDKGGEEGTPITEPARKSKRRKGQ